MKRAPYQPSTLHNTGHIFFNDNVAEGHRNFEQAEVRCDESADANPTSKCEAQPTPYPGATWDHNDKHCRRPLHCHTGVSRRAMVK